MSLSALRNTTPASRNFGAGSGLDGNSQTFDDRTWSEERKDGARATSNPPAEVIVEPHWQASIESATD